MAQINKPSLHFNTKLWSGNGSSQALTGVGHQTDMVWIKSRTDTRKHNMYDVVRGVQKRIVPNDTAAEDTVPGVTAFGTDGFTVGSETDTNGGSRNFVGWSWKANGTGSANTDGTINSTVSVNTTSGFSIVKYVGNGSGGSTVGHGLGAVPSAIWLKPLDRADNWRVYHKNIESSDPEDYFLKFNTSDNRVDSNDVWNDTAPTSTVFSLGTNAGVIANGEEFIAYCFIEKKGFSKFINYEGNASTDGPFIYTGFKPAFAILKISHPGSDSWTIWDNKRAEDNVMKKMLRVDATNAEDNSDSYKLDFLSNGIKIRASDSKLNANSSRYVAFIFAENPIVGSNNIPAVAR